MNTQDEKTLGEAILKAYKRYCREVIAFSAAKAYLLKVNIAALQGIAPIKIAHNECSNALKPEYKNPLVYFESRLYITLIAAFELFVQDIVVAVVTAYPKKAGHIEFKLSEILDASEKTELVQRAIEDILNKIMYEKPLDYLNKIASLLSIDQKQLEHLWPIFIEAKARRDVGVHNGWICNAIYLRKTKEAGIKATSKLGDSLLPCDDEYINSVASALDKLADLIADQVSSKHLTNVSI